MNKNAHYFIAAETKKPQAMSYRAANFLGPTNLEIKTLFF